MSTDQCPGDALPHVEEITGDSAPAPEGEPSPIPAARLMADMELSRNIWRRRDPGSSVAHEIVDAAGNVVANLKAFEVWDWLAARLEGTTNE